MIADSDKNTPLQVMHNENYKALSDTIIEYYQFEDLIYYQKDVA